MLELPPVLHLQIHVDYVYTWLRMDIMQVQL